MAKTAFQILNDRAQACIAASPDIILGSGASIAAGVPGVGDLRIHLLTLPDVSAALADYAPTVDPYFDQGRQTHPAILKDIATYRKQWPWRTLELIAVKRADFIDQDNLVATFRLGYTGSNGKQTRRGALIQGITYTRIGGKWLVLGVETIERLRN